MAFSGPSISMTHWANTTDSVSPLHYSGEGTDFQGGSVPQSKGTAGPGVKMHPPEVTTLEPIRHKI